MTIFKDIDVNIKFLEQQLPISDSFDIIGRSFKIGDKRAYLLFIDGFAKDDMSLFILKTLMEIDSKYAKDDLINKLVDEKIPYIEVEVTDSFETIMQSVLSGTLALFVDGEDKAVIIDARTYPARSPEESDTEKVTRGAKDCFVETVIFNTALIRRRVRDKNLTFEMKTVGKLSKTDVCIGYIKGKADEELLNNLRKKIDEINIDSLVMAEKSLEELLLPKRWFNPLPQMKYTQRPDITASFLYEGHVAIIVDTSPSVMILPASVFYFTQFAEDYYQTPIIGSYYRFIRFLTILISLLLTPTWLLLAENAEHLPQFLNFIGAKEAGAFALLFQFLLLEFGFDLLNMSSMHTPNYLGGAFGIIGGLLLGDFAIKVGFFVPETIFYMATTLIASFCIPNIEFTFSIRLFRLVLLILTGLFGAFGYCLGILYVVLMLFTTKTIDKKRPYLWPLIPFNGKALSNFIIRKKVKNNKIS